MMTADTAKRQALFDEMHRRFIADVPMIVLFNGVGTRAHCATMSKGYAGWLVSAAALLGREPAMTPARRTMLTDAQLMLGYLAQTAGDDDPDAAAGRDRPCSRWCG